MVLVAAAVPREVPALGLDSVTVKFSLDSTVASPATLTVIVLLVSPAAKLTVPLGKAPPVKSAAVAGLAPLPVTAKAAVDAPVVPPVGSLKVKAVLPLCPRQAGIGRGDRQRRSGRRVVVRIVPIAAAVPMVVPALGWTRRR